MMSGTDVVTLLVTAPKREEALALARRVVEESLAACVNVVPGVTSIFRWKGELNEEEETLLILKTSSERRARLIERVAELHSYEVPEVLALSVDDGWPPYLEWVAECTAAEPADG